MTINSVLWILLRNPLKRCREKVFALWIINDFPPNIFWSSSLLTAWCEWFRFLLFWSCVSFVVVQQDWQLLTCLVFSSEVVLEINTDLSCSFLFTAALTRPSLQAFHLDACDLHSLLCWLSLSYIKEITFCFALHYLVTLYKKDPLANIG